MADFLPTLEGIIAARKAHPDAASYTSRLLTEGLPRIAQKVGEEAVESVVAALAQHRESQIAEISDLFYHTLVMMAALDLTLDDIGEELARRHQPSGSSGSRK
jgi:phosphoribosyl-ATP pyrophosphohydrolase